MCFFIEDPASFKNILSGIPLNKKKELITNKIRLPPPGLIPWLMTRPGLT